MDRGGIVTGMTTPDDAEIQIVQAAHIAASGRRWPFAGASDAELATFGDVTRRGAATIGPASEEHIRLSARRWAEALLAEATRRPATNDPASGVADAVLAAEELLRR